MRAERLGLIEERLRELPMRSLPEDESVHQKIVPTGRIHAEVWESMTHLERVA